jgi:uncharacterized protein
MVISASLILAIVPAIGMNIGSTPAGRRDPASLIGNWPEDHLVCRAVSLRAIKVGGFLGEHINANNRKSLPAGLESPIPRAIEARAHGEEPPDVCRRLATDSDFYKWLEGACYAVAYDPSLHELAAAVDRYADMLVRLQEPNGYIGTHLSPAGPFDEKARHDLYVAGHFIEAAVAHFEATGSRELLHAAVRLADFYLHSMESRHPYFKLIEQEHPEIELALVRLYRATGEKRFLDFSATLTRMATLGPHLADVRAGAGRRHAVRLCYLLTGAAELYIQTGQQNVFEHLPALWDELVSTRMYITGGIGYNEVVPQQPYDLPQTVATKENRDIAETCASVSLMMYSWRMHAITGDSRKFDVIETILYNHYLGALSRDHLGIFYYNPLKRVGDLSHRTDHGGNPVQRTRLPSIHSTACCMPNAWRFFAQLPEYVLSVRKDGLCVNLYTDATARHDLPDGTEVNLEMQTRYPHEGQVRLKVSPDRPASFAVYLRIPGWCEKASVKVGDQTAVPVAPGTYCRVEREWRSGDEILLEMPMEPMVIFSPSQVDANRGQVAFQRGPLIYCLEKQDAAGLDIEHIRVDLDRKDGLPNVTAEFRPGLGMYVLKVKAVEKPPGLEAARRTVQMIPFFFRANREPDSRWITWLPYE